MIIPFEKYHGAGNDFIMIDTRSLQFDDSPVLIAALCDRHRGIGADGLMLLGLDADYDFSMKYYNSDGYEGSMCGNGGRCITAFALGLGIINDHARFIATDGIHESRILSGNADYCTVSLKMKDVDSVTKKGNAFFVNTGSPHHIMFINDLMNADVRSMGRSIRNSADYPEGTNVNFVEILGDEVHMRTYERGVEDETLACGTGATAVALMMMNQNPGLTQLRLHMPGGVLSVSAIRKGEGFSDILLEGPACRAFSGSFETNTYLSRI
jgi:diaminopimelate epimerase